MAHRIKLPHRQRNRTRLENDLQAISLTTQQAIDKCVRCLNLATLMAEHGKARINTVFSQNKRRWVNAWNNDEMLVRWFGEVTHKRQVRKVNRRILSVTTRLSRGIVIRLRPNVNESRNAQNNGWIFEPKRFKVFSRLLDKTDEEIASVFVHELIHLWFMDQNLNGETVYGAPLAQALARENPRKARKSAENYEHFVLELWEQNQP
ncbi:MAG: hypothetical protein P1U56_25815 [Saprospiraceae bacterium]|nr:hypothetical protein [Saprospiraceae bacterium]